MAAPPPPPPTSITDPLFIQGLSSILQPYYDRQASLSEISEVTKRAEAFFLSSQTPSSLDPPLPASNDLTTVSSVNQSPSQPPYPTSFAQLAQLIQSGQPIPGIKDVPDKLAEGDPTQSKEEVRRKPWEKQNSTLQEEREGEGEGEEEMQDGKYTTEVQ